MRVDWATLTQAGARRLLGAAERAERKAAERFNATGADADESAMLAAYMLWENLKVFSLTGERPEGVGA